MSTLQGHLPLVLSDIIPVLISLALAGIVVICLTDFLMVPALILT